MKSFEVLKKSIVLKARRPSINVRLLSSLFSYSSTFEATRPRTASDSTRGRSWASGSRPPSPTCSWNNLPSRELWKNQLILRAEISWFLARQVWTCLRWEQRTHVRCRSTGERCCWNVLGSRLFFRERLRGTLFQEQVGLLLQCCMQIRLIMTDLKTGFCCLCSINFCKDRWMICDQFNLFAAGLPLPKQLFFNKNFFVLNIAVIWSFVQLQSMLTMPTGCWQSLGNQIGSTSLDYWITLRVFTS